MGIQRAQKKPVNLKLKVQGGPGTTGIDATGERRTRMRHHKGKNTADQRHFIGEVFNSGSKN